GAKNTSASLLRRLRRLRRFLNSTPPPLLGTAIELRNFAPRSAVTSPSPPQGRRGSGRGGPLLPQGKPLSPLRKEREKPSDLHLICLLQRECSLTLPALYVSVLV